MKKYLFKLVLVVFISFIAVTHVSGAEKYYGGEFDDNIKQFRQIDKHALSVPTRYEKDVNSLVKYLIRPAKTDLQKTRAIWRWITANIAYDVQGYPLKNKPMITSAKEAFAKRTAVCGGYSKLFKQMADIAGVEAVYIVGLVKWGVGTSGGIGHAWNAVKLDGKWYLIDTTWGTGTILNWTNEEKIKYIFKYNEFWFLTKPAHMVFTHYPHQTKWQLLKNPVNVSDFTYFPIVGDSFFANDIWFASKPVGSMHLKKGESISLTAPKNISIKALVLRDGKKFKAEVIRNGNTLNIVPVMEVNARHNLRILVKDSNSSKYSFGAEYIIFPVMEKRKVQWIKLDPAHNMSIRYPKVINVIAGRETLFEFYSANTLSAQVHNAGNVYKLKKDGDTFSRRIVLSKGKIEVKLNFKYMERKKSGTVLVYEAK